jgi:hypothetical protein
MGPFSNNTPPPIAPNNGSKLPVPDVEGPLPSVIISTTPDPDGAKKWLIITLYITAAVVLTGIIVFGIYIYASNTPGYMLNAAFQNLTRSTGQAGAVSYQTTQGKNTRTISGDFLAYNDPTNPDTMTLTINAGQDASRLSAIVRIFTDDSYFQVAGLGNLGRLVGSLHGDTSALTTDNLTRLSSLDSQWYTFTADDIQQTKTLLSQRTLRSGPTSGDIETVAQLYLNHPFFTALQKLGDERIDSISTMHLKIGIDSAKFNDFLRALKSARLMSVTITDADIQSLIKMPLASTTLETWISRSDRTFEQLRVTSGGTTLTTTFASEEAAAQRQTITRPDGAQSAASFIDELHDILTMKPPAQ